MNFDYSTACDFEWQLIPKCRSAPNGANGSLAVAIF